LPRSPEGHASFRNSLHPLKAQFMKGRRRTNDRLGREIHVVARDENAKFPLHQPRRY
jgi:hypothetical protein